MPRGPLPLVDPPAADVAVRLVRRMERTGRGFPLSLSKTEREAFRAGALPIKRDSVLAASVVAIAIEELAFKRQSPRVERLRAQLRTAFGERAFRKGAQHAEWSIKLRAKREATEEWSGEGRPAAGGRQPRPMLPPGVHVAPFLSPTGNAVIVLIGPDNGLAYSVEFAPVGESLANCEPQGDEFTAANEIRIVDGAQSIMKLLGAKKIDTDVDYGPGPLPPGIHRAPWRPWAYSEGFCLVAIGKDGRLIAAMSARDAEAAAQARRELAALADALAPSEPYKDPYDDGFNDPDDCGEGWKK